MLLESSYSADDIYQYPVVLRLRELRAPNLFLAIANTLGLTVTARTLGVNGKRDLPTDVEFASATAAVDATLQHELAQQVLATSRTEYLVGDIPLEHYIADLLSSTNAVLLLDGLDELHPTVQALIRDQVARMSYRLRDSKIIMSCRTGELVTHVDGFDAIELCPLSAEEVAEIAGYWLPDPSEFLEALRSVPYGDVVDRPLLLVQLLFIYKRYGYLPPQPAQVYRKLIAILLHEWDAERGILRLSAYANFQSERKVEFLAALAHELTYRIRAKAFSDADFQLAYSLICARFSLPLSDAARVVAEVESHTGILHSGSAFTFEFSHLSLQEFLCADHIVRQPVTKRLWDYLREYPAPIAVATALSSDPSLWFAMIVLRADEQILATLAHVFVHRVVIERPGFSVSAPLGAAIMRVSSVSSTIAPKDLLELLQLPNVQESVASAFQYYRFAASVNVNRHERRFILEAVHDPLEVDGLEFPQRTTVSSSIVDNLVSRNMSEAVLLWQQVRKQSQTLDEI
jgi:hypothetical protein